VNTEPLAGSQRALILFPVGGLGNRLRATASAHILAEEAGRAFYLNWIPDPTCNARWDDLFLNRFPAFPSDMETLRASHRLHCGDAHGRLPEDTVKAILDDPRPVVAISTGQQLRPPHRDDFKQKKSEFYRALIPIGPIEEEVRRYLERVDVPAMVGVHIRRGDLISDKGANPFAISPIGLFIQACRRELASRRAPGLFLSTDSPRDERALRQAFGSLVHSRQGIALDRVSVAGIRDALVDWLLLSRTQFVIRSYFSSFSKEACAVRGIESHVIYRERPAPLGFLSDLAHRPRWQLARVLSAIARIIRRKL